MQEVLAAFIAGCRWGQQFGSTALKQRCRGGSSETPIKRTTPTQYKLQADHGLDRRGLASLGHTYFENSKEIASKGGDS